MTDLAPLKPTQAKPSSKRRRWLIAAFILVLVSLVSWWYWPRGDARPGSEEKVSGASTSPVAVVEIDSAEAFTRIVVSSAEYRMTSGSAGVWLVGDDGRELRLAMPRITYWVVGRITNVDSPIFQSPSVAGEVATIAVDVSSQNVWLQSGQKVDSLKVKFMPSVNHYDRGRWVCLGFDHQGLFVDCLYPVQPADEQAPSQTNDTHQSKDLSPLTTEPAPAANRRHDRSAGDRAELVVLAAGG